jgi:hypothetical protein
VVNNIKSFIQSASPARLLHELKLSAATATVAAAAAALPSPLLLLVLQTLN